MKKITLILFILTICFSVNAQTEFGKMSFNKAVNISGKQRMLSQKMAKLYLYLLEAPNDAKAKRALLTTKIIFEKQNDILYKNSNSNDTKSKIDQVKTLWNKNFKGIYDAAPNLKDAEKIINTNTILLQKADIVVKAIINESKNNSENLSEDAFDENIDLKNTIDLCGKQRMLAQRLALYYFANADNLKNDKAKSELIVTYAKFDNAISDLLISNFNNEKIEETLSETMLLWQEIKNNKEGLLKHKLVTKDIYNQTNQLTRLFNKLTTTYEKVKI